LTKADQAIDRLEVDAIAVRMLHPDRIPQQRSCLTIGKPRAWNAWNARNAIIRGP